MNKLQARDNVITNQIKPWGGLNYKANNAMMMIPREIFVPQEYKNLAFSDIKIPLTDKVSMFEPKIEGRILDSLNIQESDKVLEVGTGSGYLTAVMAKLANSIISIDIDKELSDLAGKRLKSLNINNAKLEVLDASKNLNYTDFFDAILVGYSTDKTTDKYLHLLNIGGRMFVFEGRGVIMSAKLITRLSEDNWETKNLFETVVDRMIGLKTIAEFKF